MTLAASFCGLKGTSCSGDLILGHYPSSPPLVLVSRKSKAWGESSPGILINACGFVFGICSQATSFLGRGPKTSSNETVKLTLLGLPGKTLVETTELSHEVLTVSVSLLRLRVVQ